MSFDEKACACTLSESEEICNNEASNFCFELPSIIGG
jgi:hypothetical protein